MRLVRTCFLMAAALVATRALHAQQSDIAVTYTGERSLKAASGQNFWLQGGAIELGVDAWKGLGVAVNVTGSHANSIGTSGVPISLVTTTFGLRYRCHAGHRWSLYGEGLVGEANGFDSLFPVTGGAVDSANGLATQVGGGIDIAFRRRFAVRVLDASWVRTTLPNATDNVQNTLHLGGGIVVRFGR